MPTAGMKRYLGLAVLAAVNVAVPWGLRAPNVPCELVAWLWLLFGTVVGWLALFLLRDETLGAPPPPLYLLAVTSATAAAASLLPPTLGSVPAVGALFWAVGGVLTDARTQLIARETQATWRTGADWSLASDPP